MADPLADFLSREQDQMADLGDESLVGEEQNNENQDLNGGIDENEAPDAEPDFEFDGETEEQQEPEEPADSYSAVRMADNHNTESPLIQQWRREFEESINAKDEAEAKAISEWRESAQHEMETWLKNYNEQLEKSRSANRETQEAFINDRDASAPGNEWERVAKLCDLGPKSGKQQSKDVSRMRNILLRLKTEPLVR